MPKFGRLGRRLLGCRLSVQPKEQRTFARRSKNARSEERQQMDNAMTTVREACCPSIQGFGMDRSIYGMEFVKGKKS